MILHSFTAGSELRFASIFDVWNWIVESFDSVTLECIRNGFCRAFSSIEISEDVSGDVSSENVEELSSKNKTKINDSMENVLDELNVVLNNFNLISDNKD